MQVAIRPHEYDASVYVVTINTGDDRVDQALDRYLKLSRPTSAMGTGTRAATGCPCAFPGSASS